MRPTELGLKSPSEKTPCAAIWHVSKTGDSLSFGRPNRGFSFSKNKRFSHYEQEASKTGNRLGPGTHCPRNNSIGVARVTKTPVYKLPTNVGGYPEEGFYMSGNHLVYDSMFVPRVKVNIFRNIQQSSFKLQEWSPDTVSSPELTTTSSKITVHLKRSPS